MDVSSPGPSGIRNFNTGRDEILAKSRDPGIFRDGISLLISSQDFSGPDWLNISILRFVGKFSGFYGHFEIIVLSDIF